MKKFRPIYITALSTALLLTACNKQLDLKPFQQIEQDQAILTSTDVQITLVGAYNRLGLSDVYGGGAFFEPDLMATQSIIDWQGTYQDLTQMVSQTIPNDNGFVANMWLSSYQAVNQANNVIANLDKAEAAQKDRMEGEAKFIRGIVYFNLVEMYGKSYNDGSPATNPGVPIVLTPTKVVDETSKVSRASVEQTYQQVIADLTDAEAKLPASNSFYANKYSAAGMLARVYLQKGDYTNAAAAANRVISANKFSLVNPYTDEFPYPAQVHVDNTTEDLFAVQVTPQQGTNSMNTYYASADDSGRGDIIVRDNFLAEFEPDDERAEVYTLDSDDVLRVGKFSNVYGNVRVIRLAEMYLIRAEANFRLGTALGATPTSDINKIRERAGLNDVATVTLASILKERRLELAFEGGFFLHDAKRLKQNVGALPYNSPKLVFPIPLREINANANLTQNEGY
ncbi:RagB/SusD family nutrient uptake outer membrane protein [Mucilaginibacter terrenus]|uniref:RagB/SusD family nutrient uptake outer membrane protein n=1 Tax=Mucilaginibacter terrenus TaxID=2482727 RepID=A0A3E2NQ26_9SPHI|nr:RagB/SusD family nutrient uptake outer membrane protein [Mucilaginibacter terrenus]RFZ82980.1 RagB/SusD family nutrient uptake outer membrane protein [Mucilaginibacter terrenus]